MTTRVLITLDGSAFSRRILPDVRDLLRPARHTLTLLRVVAPPDVPLRDSSGMVAVDYVTVPVRAAREAGRGHPAIQPAQVEAHMRGAIEDELAADMYYLQAAGFTVTVAVRFGEPAGEIVKFVERNKIDMVAMATHGRSGLTRLVLGSVAEQVLQRLSVPVLLTRPFDDAATRN